MEKIRREESEMKRAPEAAVTEIQSPTLGAASPGDGNKAERTDEALRFPAGKREIAGRRRSWMIDVAILVGALGYSACLVLSDPAPWFGAERDRSLYLQSESVESVDSGLLSP